MDAKKIIAIVIIVIATLISGWGDAKGFVHAANIWKGDKIIWVEAVKSAMGFGLGISMYWLCLRFVQQFKVISPEMQTIGWFSITIIGVALLSGKFAQWQRFDQFVGVVILIGIAWLMVRAL